jgi:hypothetical protein
MFGMLELTWIFLLLLPTQPYGKPAPASTVLAHVPPGAVVVFAVDAASLGQGVNQGLDRLLGAKFIRSTAALQQAAAQIEQGRVLIKEQIDQFGIDPFRDVRYATISLGDLDAPEPSVLAVIGGQLPDALIESLAAKAGAQRQGDRWVLPKGDGQMIMARASSGALLVGSPPWVELALAGKAQNPQLRPLLAGYDKNTFALLAFRPTAEMQARWRQEADWLVRPLLASLQGIGLGLGYDGWAVQVLFAPGSLPVWQDLLYGLGRLAVAAREATDGALFLAKAFVASLDPVAELGHDLSAEDAALLGALVQHRDEIHKLLAGMLVGPSPKTRVLVHKAQASVTLKVTGKTASLTLFPMAAGAIFWLTAARAEPMSPIPVEAIEPQPEEPADPDPADPGR